MVRVHADIGIGAAWVVGQSDTIRYTVCDLEKNGKCYHMHL